MPSYNGVRVKLINKRYLILFAFVLIVNHAAYAQSDRPQELTLQLLANIKAQAEVKSLKFRQTLAKKELLPSEINFSVDTFKISQIALKRMDVDFSTSGMNNTVLDKAASYDKLLNQYYKLLLNALQPADKSMLVATQRAWIAYRDAETKLIYTMAKKEYSGGGSMQSNIATAAYADLVIQRTLQIFNYYNNITPAK